MARLALVAALVLAGCGSTAGTQPRTSEGHSQRKPASRSRAARRRVRTDFGAPTAAMRRQAVPVLMYHVIASPPPGATYPGLWVAPSALRAQAAALARAGYVGVTLDRVLDAWEGRAALPAHPIVLSFDDGYLSQGRAAGPVLRALRWPGVLNLAWHNLGVPGMLTTSRIRRMIRDGWEIDAHTISHRDLTTLDASRLRYEVAGSRSAIRRRFGVPVDVLCYPAGRFDARVEAAVRAAGFRAATTEIGGAAMPHGDRYALRRVRVDGGDSAATVLAKVLAALRSASLGSAT